MYNSLSELFLALSKLLQEAENNYTSRLHTIIEQKLNYKGNLNQMSFRDTLTLLENMVAKVAEAEIKEDAEAKEQAENLQKQIKELQAEAVTQEDMARLDALQGQLADLLPKAPGETVPVVPPVTEPALPTPEDVKPVTTVTEPKPETVITEPVPQPVTVEPTQPTEAPVSEPTEEETSVLEPATPAAPVVPIAPVEPTPGISGEGVVDKVTPIDAPPVMDV